MRPTFRSRIRSRITSSAGRLGLAGTLLLASLPQIAQGQRAASSVVGLTRQTMRQAGDSLTAIAADAPVAEISPRDWRDVPVKPRRASWWAPLASLIVPGSGQLLLGQQRSAAYGVAEVFLLVQGLGAQRNVNDGIRDYQRVAADAARKQFGGPLPVGPWLYYEAMEQFEASGAFDRVPGGMIDPETDARTYNGRQWELARTTYWNDPEVQPATTSAEYQRALAFYTRRAFGPEFAWSWRDALNQQSVFVQAVSSTNRSNQRKTNILTLVGANHVASLVDAYITVRVRRYGGAGVAGLRLDGVETAVAAVGDPADGRRSVRTAFRLVPVGRSTR